MTVQELNTKERAMRALRQEPGLVTGSSFDRIQFLLGYLFDDNDRLRRELQELRQRLDAMEGDNK